MPLKAQKAFYLKIFNLSSSYLERFLFCLSNLTNKSYLSSSQQPQIQNNKIKLLTGQAWSSKKYIKYFVTNIKYNKGLIFRFPHQKHPKSAEFRHFFRLCYIFTFFFFYPLQNWSYNLFKGYFYSFLLLDKKVGKIKYILYYHSIIQ